MVLLGLVGEMRHRSADAPVTADEAAIKGAATLAATAMETRRKWAKYGVVGTSPTLVRL